MDVGEIIEACVLVLVLFHHMLYRNVDVGEYHGIFAYAFLSLQDLESKGS